MESLADLYQKHKKGDWPDKGSVHSYIEVYEELLRPYRSEARNILEIGLMSGESLRMWTEYFEGTVYGMDCSETPIDGLADLRPIIKEGKHNIVIGDATNPEHIKKHFEGIKFDVIIEDANHTIQQQLLIYEKLYPYFNEGGIYIVEDVQDVDRHGYLFEKLYGGHIVDLRSKKNRYDDVLIVIGK